MGKYREALEDFENSKTPNSISYPKKVVPKVLQKGISEGPIHQEKANSKAPFLALFLVAGCEVAFFCELAL